MMAVIKAYRSPRAVQTQRVDHPHTPSNDEEHEDKPLMASSPGACHISPTAKLLTKKSITTTPVNGKSYIMKRADMPEVKERKESVKDSVLHFLRGRDGGDADSVPGEEQYQDLESVEKNPTTTPTTTPPKNPRNMTPREGLPPLPLMSPGPATPLGPLTPCPVICRMDPEYMMDIIVKTPCLDDNNGERTGNTSTVLSSNTSRSSTNSRRSSISSSEMDTTTTPQTTPRSRGSREGLPPLPMMTPRPVTPLGPLTPRPVIFKMDTDSVKDMVLKSPSCLDDGKDERRGQSSMISDKKRYSFEKNPTATPKVTTPQTPRNRTSREGLPPLPMMSPRPVTPLGPLIPSPVICKMDSEYMKDIIVKTPCLDDNNNNNDERTGNNTMVSSSNTSGAATTTKRRSARRPSNSDRPSEASESICSPRKPPSRNSSSRSPSSMSNKARRSLRRTKSNDESSLVTPDMTLLEERMTLEEKLHLTSRGGSDDTKPLEEAKPRNQSHTSVASEPPPRLIGRSSSRSIGGGESPQCRSRLRSRHPSTDEAIHASSSCSIGGESPRRSSRIRSIGSRESPRRSCCSSILRRSQSQSTDEPLPSAEANPPRRSARSLRSHSMDETKASSSVCSIGSQSPRRSSTIRARLTDEALAASGEEDDMGLEPTLTLKLKLGGNGGSRNARPSEATSVVSRRASRARTRSMDGLSSRRALTTSNRQSPRHRQGMLPKSRAESLEEEEKEERLEQAPRPRLATEGSYVVSVAPTVPLSNAEPLEEEEEERTAQHELGPVAAGSISLPVPLLSPTESSSSMGSIKKRLDDIQHPKRTSSSSTISPMPKDKEYGTTRFDDAQMTTRFSKLLCSPPVPPRRRKRSSSEQLYTHD